MGLFNRNPLTSEESPPIMAYLLYALLSCISIYTTAESIISNYESVPPLLAYLVALAVIALIALAINILKRSTASRKIGLFIVGLFFLCLVWGVSLFTNTHKLFLMNNYESVVKDDRESISFALNNLLNRPLSIGQGIIIDYKNEGNILISDFDNEMTNEERPCYAEEAKKKHSKVENFLKESIEVNSFIKRYPRTRSGCIKASNAIVTNMRDVLSNKIEAMEAKLSQIEECEGFESMEQLINDIENVPFEEVDYYLDQGHNSYKKVCSCSKSILINELKANPEDFECLGLPERRWSKDIKKISNLPSFIFERDKSGKSVNGKYKSSFLYNLLIALMIDLGAIFVLYRWIFKN